VSEPTPEPGEPRQRLERAPGERYLRPGERATDEDGRLDAVAWPLAVALGTVVGFVVLGGVMAVTAGLIVVAGFAGWLIGKLASPPVLAAVVALVAIAAGFLAIWAFGRLEGGVLDPVEYLLEVEGPVVVVLTFLVGGGLAAAASRG
jgi:hypothetical protein